MCAYMYIYIYMCVCVCVCLYGLDYVDKFRDPNTGLQYVGKYYMPDCFLLFALV